MIEVDGKKYVTEEEFEEAVLKELEEVAGISANHFLETGEFEIGMEAGLMIAEAYANLRVDLFHKEARNASTGD